MAAAAIPFFLITGAFVLIGLSQMHASAHGGTGITGWLVGLVTKPLAALINVSSQAVRALTSRFAAAQLGLLASWFTAFTVLWRIVFQSYAANAIAVAKAAEAVWDAIPRQIQREVAPVRRLARRGEKLAAGALALAEVVLHDLKHFKSHVNARLRAIEHTITVTLPHEIGKIRTAERDLERIYDDLKGRTKALENGAIKTFEWLRSHQNSAAMGVFAGAVAIALTRLGFGFLRCNSWRNVGKRMTCGMGSWLLSALEAVAAFALALFSVLKPDVLAQEAVDLVDLVEPILSDILNN